MLKLDFILCPLNNKGQPIENLLQIDYEKDELTTAYFEANNKEGIEINHIPIPKKCNQMRDRLCEIIEISNLKEKVLETYATRLFLNSYPCNTSEVSLEDKELLKYIKELKN